MERGREGKAEVKAIGQWVLEAGIDSLENEYPFRMFKKDILWDAKLLVKKWGGFSTKNRL